MNTKRQINTKIKKSLPELVRLSLLLLVIISSEYTYAQTKTKKEIRIEEAEYLIYNRTEVQNAQRLIKNVKLSHENIVMYCDSAWFYSATNSVDAFGSVHIISNDTLNMYSNFLNYKGNEGIAKAIGKVKLKDPKLTLTTDTLDFDTKSEVGYYNSGGKIVDSTNVLTSKIGRYYSQRNELFFKDSVKLVNKDYTMTSDTMKYNTVSEIVTILGPTHIIGDSSYLYSEKGWFDTKNSISELLKNSTIRRGESQLQGDYIYYEDITGKGYARNNVIINDFKNKIIIAGDNAVYNDFTQNALMTDSALFIQYFNNDSLFLHADTLFTKPDTSELNQKLVICYNKVRFYKSDLQGLCDSLIYFTKDSTIQLYQNPFIWSESNQLSADFIEMKKYEKPPNKVFLKENSFIIQEMDSLKYNQIKGKNMVGLIGESNNLYQINVSGNGQSIYYPEDDKNFVGVNKAESSNIILYLKENKINRISFINTPVGTMSPIKIGLDPETRLEGFRWRGNDRPSSKYDIFRTENNSIIPLNLPNSVIGNKLPNPQDLK